MTRTRTRTAGAAGSLTALRALMRRLGGRIPYASAAAARRAALDQTEPRERRGLELLYIELPAGVGVQPDADAPAPLWGPLSWWDWGDPSEAAEEYGIDRRRIYVAKRFDGTNWRSA